MTGYDDNIPRPRGHKAIRTGFHWTVGAGSGDLYVDVPDSANVIWTQHLAPRVLDKWSGAVPRFAASDADLVTTTLLAAFGRTGHEAVEHVDVEIDLDRTVVSGQSQLHWDGMLLAYCVERGSVRLVHCELAAGALTAEGEDAQRRITWSPETVVRLAEVPRTSLHDSLGDGCRIVASSHDDPHDRLRRNGHRMLGMRYHSDIPPEPSDATPGTAPWRRLRSEDREGWQMIPTDYPSGGSEELAVNAAAEQVYVERATASGHISHYVLPLTAQRQSVVHAYEDAFGRSETAYATVGANPAAAQALIGSSFTPQRLYGLLRVVRVVDAEDAAALTGRSERQWLDAGWDLNPVTNLARQPYIGPYVPQRCWRAHDAARLADAGVTAQRAYDLRMDPEGRERTLDEVFAADQTIPTAAGRAALALLAVAAQSVPDEVTAALRSARTSATEEINRWSDEDRSGWGGRGSGLWVTLSRHDFTMPGGSRRALWSVEDGWWSFGEDGDADHTTAAYLSENSAAAAWRTACDRHRQHSYHHTEPAEQPCPGMDVLHCDNCGSTVPDNPFLPNVEWMSASLGRACGPACYDAMSDRPGKHADHHHR